jgi:hypothetical protein
MDLEKPNPIAKAANGPPQAGLAAPASAVPRGIAILTTRIRITSPAAGVDGLPEIGKASAIAPLQALAARCPEVSFIRFAAAVAIRRIGGS